MFIRPGRFFVIRATSGPDLTALHHDLWEGAAVFTGCLLAVSLLGFLVLLLEIVLKLIWPGLGAG
jgi:hypothetical protein